VFIYEKLKYEEQQIYSIKREIANIQKALSIAAYSNYFISLICVAYKKEIHIKPLFIK